jgi:hypothetical protein
MSADDTQASEWERRAATLLVKHAGIDILDGSCLCGSYFGKTAHLCVSPDPTLDELWAAHVMAEFKAAGLAAVEREQWPEEEREPGNRIRRTGRTIYRYLTPKLIRHSEPGEWGSI